jgi:hypothetical protein
MFVQNRVTGALFVRGWLRLGGTLLLSPFSRAMARAAAADPRLPGMLLWLLLFRQWDVRTAVAASPRCPRALLALLARPGGRQWAVTAAAAANPRAGRRFLDRVTLEGPARVRLHAATNPALPGTIADRLLADPDRYVRAVAAGNPAASPQALAALVGPMTEPAWILRRAGENPACPQDLSDQVLTWLALGGAGDSDPAFDPIGCTGSPGEGGPAWYLRQAATPDGYASACDHPLWRVRAMLLRQPNGVRLSGRQVWALARDPRPEVRIGIASATQLAWSVRRDLAHDGDPRVAKIARDLLRRTGASPGRWRKLAWLRQPAILTLILLGGLGGLVSLIPGSGTPSGSGLAGGGVTIIGSSGVTSLLPAHTYPLPGGGSLMCGALSTVGNGSSEPAAMVVAGSEEIGVQFTGGVVRTSDGVALDGGPQYVATGQAMAYLLPDTPVRVAVLVMKPSGAGVLALSVEACG